MNRIEHNFNNYFNTSETYYNIKLLVWFKTSVVFREKTNCMALTEIHLKISLLKRFSTPDVDVHMFRVFFVSLAPPTPSLWFQTLVTPPNSGLCHGGCTLSPLHRSDMKVCVSGFIRTFW